MPELPEVETIVRNYRDGLVGRRIVRFTSHWARQASPSVRGVQNGLRNRTITALTRRAKFIVFSLDDGGQFLVHLRMSGSFGWAMPGEISPTDGHVRAEWLLDDGRRLLFHDARKFGRIIYSRARAETLDHLGVEPLEASFTPSMLHQLLAARRRALKPLLLDQTVIAGLGNIYTDEALYRAGLHPLTSSDCVGEQAVRRLHGAIRAVLREGIRRNGTSIDWIYPSGQMQDYLRVYGRTGKPCRTCGQAIVALRVGQRGTHICPRCQPLVARTGSLPAVTKSRLRRNSGRRAAYAT